MSNYGRPFFSHSFGRLQLISIVVFFMPVFFLIVKSWVTTSLFLLFLICVWPIISNWTHYFSNRGKQFWVLLTCLVIPFFSELIAQIGRGEIVGSSLDGPSRMILAATVFVYLSRVEVSHVIRALSLGAVFGLIGIACSLLLFPEQYWQHRAATYFVDPITLPCFTLGLLGLALFLNRVAGPREIRLAIKLFLVFVAVYICIESGSRSSWVAFSCLMAAYVLYLWRRSFKYQVIGMIGLLIALFAIYLLSKTVYERVNESARGVLAFVFQGEHMNDDARLVVHHTSSGQRLLLGLVDIHLIKGSPLFGVGDRTSLPPFEELSSAIPLLSEEVYEIKILAGSHSELLAQLVRQGLLCGTATLCSLFLYPLYVFVLRFRRFTFSDGSLSVGALGIIIPILASSLTIQVFNLKMTISFYGLCLAIFFACLCQNVERESTEKTIETNFQ